MDKKKIIDVGLKRMEVAIKVARENWYVNPYLAMAALCDLNSGATSTAAVLENDDEVDAICRQIGYQEPEAIIDILHEAYKANGVDMSHFDGTCKCEIHGNN